MTSTRIYSTLVFAAIYLTAIYWRPLHFIVPLVVLAATLIGTHEYCHAAHGAKHRPSLPLAFVFATLFTLDGWLCDMRHTLAILLGALMLCAVVPVIRNQTRQAIADMAVTLFGALYVGLPLGLALAMCWNTPGGEYALQGAFLLIFVVAITWISDSGAYFVGRKWGRAKLCERLSPKKTVEGLLGGFAATIVFALVLRLLPIPGREVLSWADTIALALIFCIVAPLGDLAESVIKRDAGVKDSGRDFTGHGGILDTIDSLLFAFPATYLYFLVARPGFLE